MRHLLITGLTLTLAAGAAMAQGAPTVESPHAILALPGQVSWGPAPAVLPPGAQVAVLEGNPSEAGPFTMRVQLPDGYRIPPHFHPVTEQVTVLEGTFKVGMGDRFDASALKPLPTGAFAALQPGVRHFAQAQGKTIVQLHGVGPWSLTYVNPADDPRQETP